MSDAYKQAGAHAWWREWEVAILVLLVGATYFTRLTTLPLRGEEPRRAMVAREILWTGDWIVPRQQGEPFLSRPPLGSYPIAWLALLLGDATPLATRLPTALATLLTTLLIYGYARQFLSRTGALASALAYATMGQVLQLGQLAETEATFTLLVAGSLLLWHWGWTQGWSLYTTWSLAYVCVALGSLAKGPQAPVYFAGTIGLYLLYQRQWKALFHPAHFVGIGVFAALLGAWQIPFIVRLGWPAVSDVWGGDVGLRFVDQTWLTTLQHLVVFPLEVWVCLLPASLLLLAFLRPSFWRGIGPQAHWVSFLVIAILVTFPTCWIVPGAKPRYYMPLYPCFAPLAGLVIEELLRDGSRAWLVNLWKTYQRLLLGVAATTCALVIGLAVWPNLPAAGLRQSPGFAVLFCTISVATAAWMWTAQRAIDAAAVRQTLVASSALLGLIYTGLMMNITLSRSEDAAPQIARLRAQLPADVQLASFGLVDSNFTYHYGQPVALLPAPTTASDVPEGVDYFCIDAIGAASLPFAWRAEAVISCERWKREPPERTVIIGRRVTNVALRDGARSR